MGNGSIFPYHLTSVRWRGGTQERAIRRMVVVPMQGRRRFRVGKSVRIVESRCRRGRKTPSRDRRADCQEKPRGREVACDRTVIRHRWARRVASGARVIYGEGTRQNYPVTSGEGVPVVGDSVQEKPNPAAVNRVKRLFSKNTGVC